jgi:hypothetical protein
VGQARGGGDPDLHLWKREADVMVAIAAALTKPPFRVIVQGKTAPAETALGAADAPSWDSDHAKAGWMHVVAMAR